ncbi:MAG: hypothetical protein NC092_05500 [Butyrivibrio sp.]|nr:hypothetical protein [Butyrivibrio sp.]
MAKKKNETGAVKKVFYKKWWFWVIIIVVLAAVFGSNGNKDEENKDVSPTATQQEEISTGSNSSENSQTAKETSNTEATEELSGEEAIKATVEKVVGVENLEIFNYDPENNFSLIKFRGSENLTNNMTVKSMYLDMFNILKVIQPIIDTDVDFNVVYPLVDKYGNSEDVIVIKATYTQETIQKINFENALWENTPDLADEWWNHQAVNLTE